VAVWIDILALMVVRLDWRGRLQNLVGFCLIIREEDAEEVEGRVTGEAPAEQRCVV
jgi:hypothetical protein